MVMWNKHTELEGKHAFMGASQYRWLNWDDQTFQERYYGQYSQIIGTTLHALAHDCILSRTKISKHDKHLIELYLFKAYVPKDAYDAEAILPNLMNFVNDAIGFRMSSEILLYYSNNCFGTADSIICDDKQKELRIHDYKSGITPAHMEQLEIYAALYYLEYKKKPQDYKTILRIYQNGEIMEFIPDPMDIEEIMKRIVDRNDYITTLRGGLK